MIIGLSSFGCTGSSAVYDLLCEYDEISTPKSGKECEFTLPYSSSGLRNLEYNLFEFPVKHTAGDSAIHDFIMLTKTIERSHNRETYNRFSLLTQDYLNKIIQVQYTGFKLTGYEGSRIRWLYTLFTRILETKIRKITTKPVKLAKRHKRYISVRPDGFCKIRKIM